MAKEPPRKRQRLSEARVPIIVIDPKGDMFLEVGRNSTRDGLLLQVSRSKLSDTSTAFHHLIQPRTGDDPRIYTETRPLTWLGSDAQAVKLLMKLAHNVLPDPEDFKDDLLIRLLVLCKRLNCVEDHKTAFQAEIYRWRLDLPWDQRSCATAQKSVLSLLDILCVAYIAGDRKNFGDISHNVFKWVSTDEIHNARSYHRELLPIMPTDFRRK